MLLLHLKNSRCFPPSNLLSALVAKQPYISDSNRRNNAFRLHTAQQRHFSFTGLYTAISESAPVLTFQTVLVDLHEWSGLPWWSVILITTLGLRSVVMLPLAVHQNQVVARLSNVKEEIKNLAPELNKEVNMAKHLYKWDEDTAKRVYRKQFRELYNNAVVRDNCHPFKIGILAVIQIPVWVCLSISLRNLAICSSTWITVPEPLQSIKSEGVLWFPDMTIPDPVIIPALLLATNVVLTEMYSLRGVAKANRLQKVLLNTSRVLVVLVVVSATLNPSFVTFYWLCSSSFGVFQNLLLMSPRFRRIARIPTTPKDSQTPYRDIVHNLKNRFNKYIK